LSEQPLGWGMCPPNEALHQTAGLGRCRGASKTEARACTLESDIAVGSEGLWMKGCRLHSWVDRGAGGWARERHRAAGADRLGNRSRNPL